jgi:hypothetical protein
MTKPFEPEVGKTVKISATTSNAQGTIQVAYGQIRVYNAGPSIAFFRTGVGAQTAVAASDMPLIPGAVESFTVPAGHTGAAAICESGSATIYVTSGYGP